MFVITKHLRERYLERLNPKYRYLVKHGKDGENPKTIRLLIELQKEIRDRRLAIDEEILACLNNAEEDRSYLNNTQFMQHLYERYGYDRRVSFLVNGKATFIVVEEGDNRVVVTVVDSITHIAGLSVNRPKYRKKVPA